MTQRIEEIFKKINFLERYKSISVNNQKLCDKILKIDNKVIIDFFKSLGFINTKYIGRDKYYSIDSYSVNNNLGIELNFYTRFDEADFVLSIKCLLESPPYSGPFGLVCQKLGNDDFIRRPSFCSIEELKNIISETVLIYMDFKIELLKTNFD